MSFLSSSLSNSKPSYTSRASEPIQVSSVAVLSDLFTAGFSGSFRRACSYFVVVPITVEFLPVRRQVSCEF